MSDPVSAVPQTDETAVRRLDPSEVPPLGTPGALLRFQPPYPIRQKSAKGQPPSRQFMRYCESCHADFLGLAAGRTGEAGLWDDNPAWWCSQECYDADHSEPGRFGATPKTPRNHLRGRGA